MFILNTIEKEDKKLATFKGVALELLKKLGKEKPELEKKFLAKLSPEAKDIYIKAFNISRIPVKEGTEIKDVFAEVFFKSQASPIRHLGAISAEHALRGVYRVFLRICSPAFVLSRVPNLWAAYYDKGRCLLGESSSHRSEVLLYDFPEIPPRLLEFVAGYILGGVSVAGGKNVEVFKIEDNPQIWKWVVTWE